MGKFKNKNSTGMELGLYTLGDYLLPRGNEKLITNEM